ncbi:hypothetical protein GCM10010145_16740 [Streptomyces ruber]|uniref:Uncharacterized protein n=2 Tax=Streptomyces TaxID=1883 RepID=A0A918B9B4_9ACTN|nr:hypothetical protein GCM10010145_16740 [Streptomyces ruber]
MGTSPTPAVVLVHGGGTPVEVTIAEDASPSVLAADVPEGGTRGLAAAKRAGAAVVEAEGAFHAVAGSRPGAVAELILEAVRATG